MQQAASLAALERGELPLRAQQRLGEIGKSSGGFFTSDLSVGEFALVDAVGLRPCAQVMGSSIYHVGWQQRPGAFGMQMGGISTELTVVSQAWNTARLRAFARLEQEAKLVRADAVVGVRLTIGRHDWSAGIDRVRRRRHRRPQRGRRPSGAAGADRPLGTGLLEALAGRPPSARGRRGFHRPLRRRRLATQMTQSGFGSSWVNQELTDFTLGVYDARETALGRMTAEAQKQGAAGVVGVSISHGYSSGKPPAAAISSSPSTFSARRSASGATTAARSRCRREST